MVRSTSRSLEEGQEKPIRIAVRMSNSAGIFQLDELLKNKLEGSGLEPYVEVEATMGNDNVGVKRNNV